MSDIITTDNSSRSLIGLPPGSLVYVGAKRGILPKIKLYQYDKAVLSISEFTSVKDCLAKLEKIKYTWVHITGIEQVEIIEELCTHYGIHSLTMEDILNTRHRPKSEEYENYMYFGLKVFSEREATNDINREQFSIILGKDFTLSFSETPLAGLDRIEERLKNPKLKIRNLGSDYLAYALFDLIVDGYFHVLDSYDHRVAKTELKIFSNREPLDLDRIYKLKLQGILLRGVFLPTREIVGSILRSPTTLIDKDVRFFIRDLSDHINQICEAFDSSKESLTNILDISYSASADKTNSIVKILTTVSAIFLPLHFLVGLFGMNFKYMPLIEAQNGFWIAVGVMLTIVVSLVTYIIRNKWI